MGSSDSVPHRTLPHENDVLIVPDHSDLVHVDRQEQTDLFFFCKYRHSQVGPFSHPDFAEYFLGTFFPKKDLPEGGPCKFRSRGTTLPMTGRKFPMSSTTQ